jgi:Uncharacterized protein required for formate dehydrogenase activity
MMEIPRHALVKAWDEHGNVRNIALADEQPLTVCVNDRVLVTLMTLGSYPEALAIGYLRNQRLISSFDDITAVDWQGDVVRITTREPLDDVRASFGCATGSAFSSFDAMASFDKKQYLFSHDALMMFLEQARQHETHDKKTGAVHACALANHRGTHSEIVYFVEDVSRHNAVDTIAGLMWMAGVLGEHHAFYATGRITYEMTMKVANMGVPVIVSRSMPSKAACEVAEKMNMIIIGRARCQQYLLFGNNEGFQRNS